MMWFRPLAIALIAGTLIVIGVNWLRRSLSSVQPYSLAEDVRHTFLIPRMRYSAQLSEGPPRRVAPAMVIGGGVVVLLVGLAKTLPL